MKIGIVGRVNVGKSTLFNRLSGNYRAIVTEIAGTTREIISDQIQLGEGNFVTMMDSPGLLDFKEELIFIEKIIKESDILLFVFDGKAGITAADNDIRNLIFKHGKKDKTILIINKLDGNTFGKKTMSMMAEFYELGFDSIIPVSAKNNENLDELVEEIMSLITKKDYEFEHKNLDDNVIPFAIVGRPNVGKSSLINKLAQDEIACVSEVAGTTLDYLTADINFHGKQFRIYDTAGIRKKGKIHGLEKIAFDKTIQMIKFINPITIIMVDIVEGMTHRDLSLIGDIIKLDVPVVIGVNKIDEIDKKDFDKYFNNITKFLDFARWIPIIPISAKEGFGLPNLIKSIEKIWSEYGKSISTSELNRVINAAWMTKPPRFPKNKSCKILYGLQKEAKPPKFMFYVNKADNANFSFKKWLDNVLRKEYGFIGIPLVFEFKEK